MLYPREYNAVNVGGTVSLMEAMRDVGVRRVVLISSGAIYGDQSEQPLRESMIPKPRSPYAVSKLAAEFYVDTIGDLWDIETISLRVFNAYGPGQHLPPSHPPVVPNFLRQALRGGSLVVLETARRPAITSMSMTSFQRWWPLRPRPTWTAWSSTSGAGSRPRPQPGADRARCDRFLRRTDLQPKYARRRLAHVRRSDPGGKKLNYRPSISLEEGLRLTLQRDPRLKK